ncbi:MAG TPA: Calx-beta domain-containing protein [Pyrinomonadaceae bacterium]
MSSPRFGVAPAVGATSAATQRLQKRVGGKTGAVRTQAAAPTSAKSVSKAAAKGAGEGDVQPNVFCAQTLPISAGQTNGSLTSTDCKLSDNTAFDEYIFNGTAGQQISITLNSNEFDAYLFLVRPGETTLSNQTIQDDDGGIGGEGRDGNPNTNSRIPAGSGVITLPTTGQYSILANAFDAGAAGLGAYTLTLTLGATCSSTPINFNETKAGSLATGDCTNPVEEDDDSLADLYTFTGTAGQQISITMTATTPGNVDPFLYLVLPSGDVHAFDNNGGGGTTARLPQFTGTFGRLPMTGTYTIVANTVLATQSGNYTLTLGQTAVCPSTPIAVGGTANGSLANTDCRLLEDSSFIDAYTFNGTAGQTVVISMTSAATTLNPVLFLLSPEGIPLAIEVATGGSSTVRIPPGTGSFTLPVTGTYTILTNSFEPGQTGNYTLRLVDPSVCTTTLATTGRDVSGAGGSFSFNFTTQPGCAVSAASNSGFIVLNTASIDSNGAGTATYTVQPNTASTARTGTITVNGQTFTVTQAAACTYAVYPTVRPFTQDSSTSGRFTVITQNGCPWSATTTTPWITITEGTAATTGTGRVRYTVAANNTTSTRTGTITVNGSLTHTVTQTSAGTTPQVQFSGNAEFTVNENDASRAATINVTRTGDTTGAVTVEYATLDDTAEVPCDPNIKRADGTLYPQGTAYARCDYASTIDTLTFLPGETTRSIRIPLINDVFQENTETFAISLFNPQGATLGNFASGIIRLQSDDLALPTSNPINQIPFFVRQHYLDFLDREPEAGEPWSGVLTNCPQNIFSGPEVNTNCDRIAVSGAFFGSPEYRIKGLNVFLHYKAAFGSANNPLYVPEYNEFVRDTRRVSGLTAEEVIAKRLDFSEDFLARVPVANVFSGTTNEAFVDRILSNLGIALTNPDPASGETRNSLVNALNAGTKTRAQVLRLIVESTEAIAAHFNRAFVAIQYYGYLRRTPEPQGYQNNLNVLNATNNSRQLINGFLNSIEYRLRFGANTTNP